jgi:hypothetical protein
MRKMYLGITCAAIGSKVLIFAYLLKKFGTFKIITTFASEILRDFHSIIVWRVPLLVKISTFLPPYKRAYNSP